MFEIFKIWVEFQTDMFCDLILLPYVKKSICLMTDNNSNTSFSNSESERKLPDFNTFKPFDMEPREKVNGKNYA